MKRILGAAVLVAASTLACGSGSSSLPTPRPSGQRGTLLNPVDRAHDTVDQLNQQQEQEDKQTGSSDDNP